VALQRAVIPSRTNLERGLREVERQFAGREIPLPPHWGGYRVKPESIEFWQGRESRLHDRIRYVRLEEAWRIERLAP
jgi:pyridoxamine 5'-phosphate oxidase